MLIVSLNFNPKIAIVLNIEEDHLDYFSGIDEIKASLINLENYYLKMVIL